MFQAAVAAQGPKLVKQVKGVIVYVVTGGPKKKKWTFYTDLKNGDGSVGEGKVKKVRAARRRTRARRDQRHTLNRAAAAGGPDRHDEGRRLHGHRGRQAEAADGLHARPAQDQGQHGPRHEAAGRDRRGAQGVWPEALIGHGSVWRAGVLCFF